MITIVGSIVVHASEIPNFVKVYVKASLDTCIKRDPKGLYQKTKQGEIQNMTCISSPYEEPINLEIILDTEKSIPQECLEKIISYLKVWISKISITTRNWRSMTQAFRKVKHASSKEANITISKNTIKVLWHKSRSICHEKILERLNYSAKNNQRS
jgi:hypothetical protein